MNKESILYGVIGLLAGMIIAGFTTAYAVNNHHGDMMRMHGYSGNHSMMSHDDSMLMSQMTSPLKNKTGDDFDKAFLATMITHHQGAIDMARLAQDNAKHAEIKSMANDIISAQSKEISLMQTWQGDWSYKSAPSTE